MPICNDAANQLTKSIDARSGAQVFTDARTQTTTFTYDDLLRLTDVATPDNMLAYVYDANGRLSALVHADGVGSLAGFGYSYDPAGNSTLVALRFRSARRAQ